MSVYYWPNEPTIEDFYGGSSLGAVERRVGHGCGAKLTITKATWAVGLWKGSLLGKLDLWNAAFDTKLNEVPLTVTGFEHTSRFVYVTGMYRDIERIVPGTHLAAHKA